MAEGRSERHLWPERKWHLWKCVDSLGEGLERGGGASCGGAAQHGSQGSCMGAECLVLGNIRNGVSLR